MQDNGFKEDIKDDYSRFQYIKKKLFTISNLDTPVSNPTKENETKVVTVVTCLGIFWALLYITQSRMILKLLPISGKWMFFLYCVVAVGTTAWIATLLSTSLREKVKFRNESQDGNSKFSLSDIWNITPAGISEMQFDTENTVSVKYDTQAFILRGIMTGIVDLPDNQDRIHYQSMARFIDIIAREGYELSRFVIPYNTANDPIWDNETLKIAKASDNGSAYTMFRTSLMNSCLEFTEANSKVLVSYYIIKAGFSTKCDINTLVHEILKLNKVGCMKFEGINLKEFKNLLEDYYGVSVSLEDIANFMTKTQVDMGECKLISYEDKDGTLIKFSKYTDYNLPRVFSTLSMIGSIDLPEDEDNSEYRYSTSQDDGIFSGEIVD